LIVGLKMVVLDNKMGDNNLHDCIPTQDCFTHSMIKKAQKDELIPGMGEILQHIHDQGEKIKKMEEELFTIHHGTQLETGMTLLELKEKVKNLEINEEVREVALQIVKDENEVNKKNMFRCMEENVKLTKENITLKEDVRHLRSDIHLDSSSSEEEEDDSEYVYGTHPMKYHKFTMAGGGDHWYNYLLFPNGTIHREDINHPEGVKVFHGLTMWFNTETKHIKFGEVLNDLPDLDDWHEATELFFED
jgi:Zn-dependent metalloprotease